MAVFFRILPEVFMNSDGTSRRKIILDILAKQNTPVSGTALAKKCHVSRQVIVQDIALLRAENKEIISTNRGYLLYHPFSENGQPRTPVYVSHTADQILDEMYTIVDLGGAMLDVYVDHDLYGQIRADLVIRSRQDADRFVAKMKSSGSKPLKALTGDCHYHTISAPSEKILNLIRAELKEKGYLIR